MEGPGVALDGFAQDHARLVASLQEMAAAANNTERSEIASEILRIAQSLDEVR